VTPGNAKAKMTPRKTMLLAALALSLGCDPAPASEPDPSDPRPAADQSASDELDGGADGGGSCVPTPGPKAPAGRLLFVLDKSSSMGAGTRESAPALLGRPSRWAKTHALVSALAGRFEGDMQLGAGLFPSHYADVGGEAVQCDLLDIPDLPVGDHGADTLVARLPAADEVDFAGGSPATLALRMAALHLGDLPEGSPAAIVLVTDGGANCADEDAPLVQFDESLADVVAFTHDELQIPTFVVAAAPSSQEQAVPKIDPREALREIALAGGVPHPDDGYFDVADPEALAAAIADRFGIVEDETAANCQ
jgi:hypothetical protein